MNCPFEVFSAYGDAKVNVTSGHPIGARLKSADFACCANPFRDLNSHQALSATVPYTSFSNPLKIVLFFFMGVRADLISLKPRRACVKSRATLQLSDARPPDWCPLPLAGKSKAGSDLGNFSDRSSVGTRMLVYIIPSFITILATRAP